MESVLLLAAIVALLVLVLRPRAPFPAPERIVVLVPQQQPQNSLGCIPLLVLAIIFLLLLANGGGVSFRP